jgi:hypothetical protein
MPSKVSRGHKSVKHDIIDKTNSRMILTVGIATFIFVFSVFAAKALISQSLYQNRIITEKESTLSQINSNKKALEELKKSFDSFQSQAENILGGSSTGNGPLDGKNAELILDALPSKYDYPGLSSSFEKILKEGGYTIGSIGGTEDPTLASINEPVRKTTTTEIPYAFTVNTDVEGMKKLLSTLERSIRPMYVDSMQIQVGDNLLQARVGLHTFFTQTKTYDLGSKEIK